MEPRATTIYEGDGVRISNGVTEATKVNGAKIWVSVHLRSLRSSVLHAVPSGSLFARLQHLLRALQALAVPTVRFDPHKPDHVRMLIEREAHLVGAAVEIVAVTARAKLCPSSA